MKRVCMVTGGTGGHIYPALSLADTIKKQNPDCEILFIGNDDRMEADLIPAAGYNFKSLHTSGLVGSPVKRAGALLQMGQAYFKARNYLNEFNPDAVIGFGGYVSAPVILAANSMNIPTVIHEQNSIVGKANQLVMNRVDAIAICYEKTLETFPAKKCHYVGNPRATVAAESSYDKNYFRSLGLDPNKKTVLVMMGSLGSSSVNELMAEALKSAGKDLQFLYVLGKDNEGDATLFEGLDNVVTAGFVDTMKIYKNLYGIICRAGATTLAEITALGIPAILIPSPYVANNHQFYNASVLVDADAAAMIEEKDLNAAALAEKISSLFESDKARESASINALSLAKPKAAYDLISLLEDLSREND